MKKTNWLQAKKDNSSSGEKKACMYGGKKWNRGSTARSCMYGGK